jgi:hypothetical protein
MARLVSLSAVKARQRIDTSASDVDIIDAIEGASQKILNYIASSDPSFLDSDGDPLEDSNGDAIDIPADVRTAAHVLTGMILCDPSGKDWAGEPGFLPAAVACWLVDYRLPTVA